LATMVATAGDGLVVTPWFITVWAPLIARSGCRWADAVVASWVGSSMASPPTAWRRSALAAVRVSGGLLLTVTRLSVMRGFHFRRRRCCAGHGRAGRTALNSAVDATRASRCWCEPAIARCGDQSPRYLPGQRRCQVPSRLSIGRPGRWMLISP
jgi:hypothetical protein